MKLGISTFLFNEWPLKKVVDFVAPLGYEMVELPVWEGNRHLDARAILKGGEGSALKKMLRDSGIAISGLNNAIAGQLVLGPHDESTDAWSPSSDPQEKIRYGIAQMKLAAQVASELEVPVVNGFVGSHVWDKWYIFPPQNEKQYEEAWTIFADRWNGILDTFKEYGVKFGFEVHPTEIAYNIETAEQAVKTLDERPEFGFNFDPSHFVWQLIDPVLFIKRFGSRIFHCHAKDAELQEDEVHRSGVIPTGGWLRSDRGFRFRVPGWGQVNWRRIISALVSIGYDYVLSFEHEDPVMSPEDGAEKAIEYLRPLIIKKPLKKAWW